MGPKYSSEVLLNLINKATLLLGPTFLVPEVVLLMKFHCSFLNPNDINFVTLLQIHACSTFSKINFVGFTLSTERAGQGLALQVEVYVCSKWSAGSLSAKNHNLPMQLFVKMKLGSFCLQWISHQPRSVPDKESIFTIWKFICHRNLIKTNDLLKFLSMYTVMRQRCLNFEWKKHGNTNWRLCC